MQKNKDQKSMPWLLLAIIIVIIAALAFLTFHKPPIKQSQPIGSKIYYKHCAVCHHNATAGAPKPNDVNAWLTAYKQSGGMQGLVAAVENGKGVMPAMGTCKACSKAQLKEAIVFMLPEKVRSLEKFKNAEP